MKGNMMGRVVRLLKRSTNAADSQAGAIAANIVELPFREARYQIANVASNCEMLRQSIDALHRATMQLEGILGIVDDYETREELRRHLSSTNKMLLLEMAKLSSVDQMLQASLRRTCRSGTDNQKPSLAGRDRGTRAEF
jgi:hypothetical protein